MGDAAAAAAFVGVGAERVMPASGMRESVAGKVCGGGERTGVLDADAVVVTPADFMGDAADASASAVPRSSPPQTGAGQDSGLQKLTAIRRSTQSIGTQMRTPE